MLSLDPSTSCHGTFTSRMSMDCLSHKIIISVSNAHRRKCKLLDTKLLAGFVNNLNPHCVSFTFAETNKFTKKWNAFINIVRTIVLLTADVFSKCAREPKTAINDLSPSMDEFLSIMTCNSLVRFSIPFPKSVAPSASTIRWNTPSARCIPVFTAAPFPEFCFKETIFHFDSSE